MSPEQSAERERYVLCRPSGKGDPLDRVAGREIADSQDNLAPTFHRGRRIGQIHSPDRSRLQPVELIEPRPPPAPMYQPVRPKLTLKRAAGSPGQKGAESRHSDVGTHAPEELVDQACCGRIQFR